MSYNLDLKVENGFIRLVSMTGEVPEGNFNIWGHNSGTQEDLGIARRAADGTFAGSANHAHPITAGSKPEPDGDPF